MKTNSNEGAPTFFLHFSLPRPLQIHIGLMQLQPARRREVQPTSSELGEISTPLRRNLHTWKTHMQGHPDTVFAAYVLDGIDRGFRVGFNYARKLCSVHRHMPSATQHPELWILICRRSFPVAALLVTSLQLQRHGST